MSNRNNNINRRVAKRAVSADEPLPSRNNKIRRTARALSVDAVSDEPIRNDSNIIQNQPFVRLQRISESNLLSIVESPNEVSTSVDLLPNVESSGNVLPNVASLENVLPSGEFLPNQESNNVESIENVLPSVGSDANINNNNKKKRRVIFAHRGLTHRSVSSTSAVEQLPVQNNNSGSSIDDVNHEENSGQPVACLASNEQAAATVSMPVHHPMIILNRLSEEELNIYDFHDDDAFSQSGENGSQISTGGSQGEGENGSQISTDSQGEQIIFSRFEFVNGVRASTQLMFIHDIEQLYFLRYKNSKGTVYECRDRKKCKAKAIIDSSGVCKQVGSTLHSHPTVREDFENILLRNRMRDDCSNDDILRH